MRDQAALITTIRSIPWFNDLSSASVQQLSLIAETKSAEQDSIIYDDGGQHGYMYIILSGRIQIESTFPGYGFLPIHFAEPLDVIGWSSLTPVVRQNPDCARALENSKLLAFHAPELKQLCEVNHEIGFNIMNRLANIVASSLLNYRLKLLGLITPKNHNKQSL